MGASIRKSSRGGKRHQAIAEINVTPFVDVMLVLLIVFMVAAPLLTSGISIDIPQSRAGSLSEQDTTPIEVNLDGSGTIMIGETEVERERMIALLTEMMDAKTDQRIYLRADQGLDYGEVMEILGAINRAGFTKVALVTKPATSTP